MSHSDPANSSPSSARTAKSFGERSTIFELLSAPVLWSALQESASSLPIVFLGLWWSTKLKRARYRDHCACLLLSCLAVMKYSRFLWSVQISHGCSAPLM